MSSPRRIGLPETLRMRHDVHFVDQLGRPGGEPVGRMVPIEDIEPNPHQPRQHMGDLSELIASVREKGVLEPILVRPRGSRFQIIAGERRYRAAIEAGLAEMPCIVRETSDAEMMEIALIENLQRKDLSAFEEADGLKMLADSYGYTHEAMAERLGKSRTLDHRGPEPERDAGRGASGLSAGRHSIQVIAAAGCSAVATRRKWSRSSSACSTTDDATREDARRIAKQGKAKSAKGRPRHYVFRYEPREKSFALALQFRKSDVPREEIVRALQTIIEDLLREEA